MISQQSGLKIMTCCDVRMSPSFLITFGFAMTRTLPAWIVTHSANSTWICNLLAVYECFEDHIRLCTSMVDLAATGGDQVPHCHMQGIGDFLCYKIQQRTGRKLQMCLHPESEQPAASLAPLGSEHCVAISAADHCAAANNHPVTSTNGGRRLQASAARNLL